MSAAKQLVDMRFLRTLVPLGELSDVQLQQLMGSYSVELVPSGTKLFRRGDHDASTYYLLSGQIKLIFLDGVEKTIRSQTTQSRYILVPERPRCATAVTVSTTTILKIDKASLDNIVAGKENPGMEVHELKSENHNDWMTRYLQSKVFLKLRAQNIQALMMRLEEIPVRTGQVIIRQNDDDGYYYIIKQGHCKVSRRNSQYEEEIEQAQLTVGTGFGEEAIISQNRRGATVTMLDDGYLMRLSRKDFVRILVEPLIKDVVYEDALKFEDVVFLDVRHYDDYVKDGLTDSVNITLFEIRGHLESLDKTKTYIAYSNHGHRAAAAAFLLCQQGLEGIILRAGLDGVPDNAARGNKPDVDENNIPVVDNVISFDKSKQAVTSPRGLPKPAAAAEADLPAPRTFSPEQALQDPRVQSLLQHASDNVQQGVEKELLSDVARQKAEHEVLRLKMEAKLAKRSADQARHKAEQHAHKVAHEADQKARDESARLRELELGAKQAEMEEAMRQVDDEAKRAKDAESARIQAERENALLKQRLELAISSAEEEAERSAETIRSFALKEEEKQLLAAQKQRELTELRNREIEATRISAQKEIEDLKQEVEYTRLRMRQQAELDAHKARDEAKKNAEKKAQIELDLMQEELLATKEQTEIRLESALKAAQIEADKSAETIREISKKEQETLRLAEITQREITEANQREIEILKSEIEITRLTMQQQAELEAKNAREEARFNAERVAQEELDRMHLELKTSQQESEQEINDTLRREAEKQQKIADFADEQSKRAEAAEHANASSKIEIINIKRDMEVVRKQQHEASIIAAEQARQEAIKKAGEESEIVILEKEREISEAIDFAENCSLRARAAEAARDKAVEQTKNLQGDVASTQQQLQADLSQDIARSEIEHEVAKARAVELANKQAEIEEIRGSIDEVASRAQETERAKQDAEEEVEKLKAEIERIHTEHQNFSEHTIENLERQLEHDKEVKLKEAEFEQAAKIAEHEGERARLAEIAHQEAEEEIQHLKTEVEIATLQATAQLASDKERSEAQEEEMQQKTKALAEKQTLVISAIERAQLEKRRAKEADVARLDAEQALESYREDAEHHEKIQQEISKVRAESISKHVAMEAAAKRARKEAARAENAERARGEAELEIVRLKKIAAVRHRKAEQAIRQSLDVVNKSAKKPMKSTKKESAQKSKDPVETKSAWVSDHVMWETTLGLRNDKDVAAIIAPDVNQEENSEPWAEQLLTKIAVPDADPDMVAWNDDEDDVFSRTKFKTREVNHSITAQLDSREFIKRNHAEKKPVVLIILLIALGMVIAMYFAMSSSQREEFNSGIKNIVYTKKDKLDNTKKEIIPKSSKQAPNKLSKRSSKKSLAPKKLETIEQRIERKRKKVRQSLQRANIREEKELRKLDFENSQRFKKKKVAIVPLLDEATTPLSDLEEPTLRDNPKFDNAGKTPTIITTYPASDVQISEPNRVSEQNSNRKQAQGRSQSQPQRQQQRQQQRLQQRLQQGQPQGQREEQNSIQNFQDGATRSGSVPRNNLDILLDDVDANNNGLNDKRVQGNSTGRVTTVFKPTRLPAPVAQKPQNIEKKSPEPESTDDDLEDVF